MLAITMLATAGCDPGLAEVEGRVTFDGNPLTGSIICFQPVSGPLVQASVDDGGRYRLETPGVGFGAAPGSYRVYLMSIPSDEAESAKSSIRESDLIAGRTPPRVVVPTIPPALFRYYSPLTSDWRREIVPGRNELDFDVVTRK